MGKTAFHGPVYGAKGLLAKYSAGAASSTGASSALTMAWIVPSYEDWFVCELSAYCSTCSSGGNVFALKTEGGSTTGVLPRAKAPGNGSTRAATLGSINTGTSTGGPFLTTISADPGEFEGAWVPAGSTLRLVLSSVANPIANLNFSVRGFTRFVASTRTNM